MSLRILVTGGSGFVGQHVVGELAKCYDVVCLHRRPFLIPDVQNIELGSWTCDQIVDQVESADLVLHLAAAGTRGPAAFDQLVSDNVALSVELLRAAQNLGASRFLYAGSWSEIPSLLDGLEGAHRPLSMYGAAKAAAWILLQALGASLGTQLLNLRLYNVYGPGEASSRLIPYLLKEGNEGRIPALTHGEQLRDFVYVSDVARAFASAVDKDWVEWPSVIEICSGTAQPVKNIVEAVSRELNAPHLLEGVGLRESRLDEPASIVGDPSNAAMFLSWSASTTLSDGIRKTIHATRIP